MSFCFFIAAALPTLVYSHAGHSHAPSTTSENFALAFGLTLFASFAAAIGAALPFLDILFARFNISFRISKSSAFLSSMLSLSAGIILSLSLLGLYPAALVSFTKSNSMSPQLIPLVTSCLFLSGIICILVLRTIKNRFGKRKCQCNPEAEVCECRNTEEGRANVNGECFCRINECNSSEKVKGCCKPTEVENVVDVEMGQSTPVEQEPRNVPQDPHLKKLGTHIAIALALHNFPEGVATFTSSLGSSKLGAIFAIAMFLHKVPEGLIIALPFYYSTGSKLNAFLISAGSSILSQMLGAVLAWLVFSRIWSEIVPGVVYSLVSGILTFISIDGLMPTARRYGTAWTSVFFFVGFGLTMFVDAIFQFAE